MGRCRLRRLAVVTLSGAKPKRLSKPCEPEGRSVMFGTGKPRWMAELTGCVVGCIPFGFVVRHRSIAICSSLLMNINMNKLLRHES